MAKKNKPFAIGDSMADVTLKNLPFVFFVGGLLLIYLFVISYAQKRIVRIEALKKEVEDLRREYNALEAEISYRSVYSQVKKAAAADELQSNGYRIFLIEPETE